MGVIRTAWCKALDRLGGRARAEVVAVLAAVFALDGADAGSVGAMAGPLQEAFGVSKTEIGLLLTVSLGLGALATLPFGWLVDRVNRTRLLAITVSLWSVAMFLAASATSYVFLLISRLLLAGVTAAAAPAIASLVGDWFPPGDRARIYGAILAGELVGTGVGFFLAGEAAIWTWRAGFGLLGLPALLVGWLVWRLPEPEHGGASRLARGQEHLREGEGPSDEGAAEANEPTEEERALRDELERRHVHVRDGLILDADPRERSLWWALGYVLRIPSNVVLIVASALGYFYFTGVRTFGLEYLKGWFGVSQGVATALVLVLGVGGVAGVLTAGQLGDRLLAHGWLRARVAVAVAAYAFVVVMLVPALLTRILWVGMLCLTFVAAGLGAMNPPLDAARLDIMPEGLWGRAESVRVALRKAAEASAPVLFGLLAERTFGTPGARDETGMHWSLLTMGTSILLAAGVSLVALWTYPRDVATALENDERVAAG